MRLNASLTIKSFSENNFRNHTQIKRMSSSGLLRRVALVRADVTEERSTSVISVTRSHSISSQPASVASCG
jgi:hypothetical protein